MKKRQPPLKIQGSVLVPEQVKLTFVEEIGGQTVDSLRGPRIL